MIKSFSGFFLIIFILILISASKTEYVEDFKIAEVRLLYKKDGRKEKSDYRPVSILSNVSKVYKRCLYDQVYDFFENKFSRCQCGFRKGFNTQNALLSMVEKMLLGGNKKEVSEAILISNSYINNTLKISHS